jgi:hypothetical protein
MTNLLVSASVTLNASGSGTASIGPGSQPGSPTWRVTGIIVQTTRPGQAPIPRIQVYLDSQDVGSILGLSYDGSFNQGATNLTVGRGQQLIAVWTGGQSGDIASITVTGEK